MDEAGPLLLAAPGVGRLLAGRVGGDSHHEFRLRALGLAHHVDAREAFHDFFPQDLQLHLGDMIAHAAMDAKAETQARAEAKAEIKVDAESKAIETDSKKPKSSACVVL